MTAGPSLRARWIAALLALPVLPSPGGPSARRDGRGRYCDDHSPRHSDNPAAPLTRRERRAALNLAHALSHDGTGSPGLTALRPGVGRTTVTRALSKLEHTGWLVRGPRRSLGYRGGRALDTFRLIAPDNGDGGRAHAPGRHLCSR